MKELTKKELETTTGGFSGWVALGIFAGVSFLVGVFDGIARPLKCNF